MSKKRIPQKGRDHSQLLSEMSAFREHDADWRAGKTWSMVYYAGDEHHELLKQAHQLYFAENALNPIAFKSLKQMETEVVQMTASMLNAPDEAVGVMTSGGTESLLVIVQAYRDRARKKKPWVIHPNIVAPITIHPAFAKAAHYFGVKIKHAPILQNGQVDVEKMKRLIDRSTIALAASAPQYAHGVVDPIPEIGAIAQEKKLPFHVDGCFGGYMQPWLERLGVDMPIWDFRVSGVTSMSADTHKYGYAAKGASVVVYRDMDYLKHQFFIATYWPGGIYISPSMQGTRSGGVIAAAWASLQGMGEDGYLERAEGAWKNAQRLRAGIEAIDGLRLLGMPHSTIVTWASDAKDVDVYAVADLLSKKGWALDRQQDPPSIHCTVNSWNSLSLDDYLSELEEAVAYARQHPELSTKGEAATYGLMAKVPVKGFVTAAVREVMEQMYAADGGGSPDLEDGGPLSGPFGAIAGKLLNVVDDVRQRVRKIRGGGGSGMV